jgi:hypothetical protein
VARMVRRLLGKGAYTSSILVPAYTRFADAFEPHRLFDTAAWLSGLKRATFNRLIGPHLSQETPDPLVRIQPLPPFHDPHQTLKDLRARRFIVGQTAGV